MAFAEYYVGTQGGGMDHAVCLLAEPGAALRIDFFPLQTYPIAFPEGCLILAAHSTVHAAKAQSQRLAYNRRVLECAISKDLLARRLGAPDAERLADLCRADGAPPLLQMTDLLSEITAGAESLSTVQAADLFGLSADEFVVAHLRMKDGSIMPEPAGGLKALPRCRHVFSEAARVEAATACLACGDVEGLGQLMNESHRSCADDYELSVPELDRLVELMRDAGALGARLTGAGFGGFAIALVESGTAEQVHARLADEFYAPRGRRPEDNVYAFTPTAGATVEEL
jgi:N-acetylgalactosamine kinase